VCAIPHTIPASRLLPWNLAAVEPESFQNHGEPVSVVPPAEHWMPSAPAGEVAREVVPCLAGALLPAAVVTAPGVAPLAIDQPTVRWAGGWLPAANAEAVFSHVSPRVAEALPAALAAGRGLCLPDLTTLHSRQSTPRGERAASLAGSADGGYPGAAQPPQTALPVLAVQSPEGGSGRRPHLIQFPALALRQTDGRDSSEFKPADVPAAEPPAGAPTAASTMPSRDAGHAALVSPEAARNFGLPQPGAAAAEFFCQRAPMTPVRRLQWLARPATIYPPRFAVRPIFERIDEAEPVKPVNRTPAFAEIFAISEAARRRTHRNHAGSLGKAIAAALLVGIGLWFGAGSVKIGRQMVAINTSFPNTSGSGSGQERYSPSAPSGFPSLSDASPPSHPGPIARVRRAIQQRAAVELTDTFGRMEAWGAKARELPAGWSRHPDGFMRTGQLALYRPSQAFADYRFEFFGEIEKKGMSWAVRARDLENYYAMKFTVIEPGLRPVIAAVHYPVVGGHKGQRVETPLGIMVHNHEPYRVTVEVKGNRVVTSIEGQEVDSWTDDALKAGGVGFFSEAGESARLYWIRVTKNQDWLGRVCAYLSNGSSTNTADLWRGDIPAAPPQPFPPALPPAADTVLAAAETEEFSQIGPPWARILKYGRTEPCRS
jgi:hypothetical protein